MIKKYSFLLEAMIAGFSNKAARRMAKQVSNGLTGRNAKIQAGQDFISTISQRRQGKAIGQQRQLGNRLSNFSIFGWRPFKGYGDANLKKADEMRKSLSNQQKAYIKDTLIERAPENSGLRIGSSYHRNLPSEAAQNRATFFGSKNTNSAVDYSATSQLTKQQRIDRLSPEAKQRILEKRAARAKEAQAPAQQQVKNANPVNDIIPPKTNVVNTPPKAKGPKPIPDGFDQTAFSNLQSKEQSKIRRWYAKQQRGEKLDANQQKAWDSYLARYGKKQPPQAAPTPTPKPATTTPAQPQQPASTSAPSEGVKTPATAQAQPQQQAPASKPASTLTDNVPSNINPALLYGGGIGALTLGGMALSRD